MNREIIDKLDEITALIDESNLFKEYKRVEKIIEQDTSLLSKINLLKNENCYSEKYVNLKKEILNDNNFSYYKKLEKELYFLVQNINIKLKELVKI